jgi:hypothetical protein
MSSETPTQAVLPIAEPSAIPSALAHLLGSAFGACFSLRFRSTADYGEPQAGALRWQASEEVGAWAAVRRTREHPDQ